MQELKQFHQYDSPLRVWERKMVQEHVHVTKDTRGRVVNHVQRDSTMTQTSVQVNDHL